MSPSFLRTRYNSRVQQHLEYAALWLLLKIIGALPRPLARFVGARTAAFLFLLRPELRAAAAEITGHYHNGRPRSAVEALSDP